MGLITLFAYLNLRMVIVSDEVSLSLFLQLEDLLTAVQVEIDHSTAVLDEFYGDRSRLGLDKLSLATRRIDSNIHNSVYRDNLPYVPRRTGFSADPNLIALLVHPLYGDFPGVAVRELMQNAADAVVE